MRFLSSLLFLAFLPACGTAVIDGVTVLKDDYDHARQEILTRATVELACPRASLTTQVLNVVPAGNLSRLAVRGCGKDVVYADGVDGFRIETSPPPPER
jgi:hypothetical protein